MNDFFNNLIFYLYIQIASGHFFWISPNIYAVEFLSFKICIKLAVNACYKGFTSFKTQNVNESARNSFLAKTKVHSVLSAHKHVSKMIEIILPCRFY